MRCSRASADDISSSAWISVWQPLLARNVNVPDATRETVMAAFPRGCKTKAGTFMVILSDAVTTVRQPQPSKGRSARVLRDFCVKVRRISRGGAYNLLLHLAIVWQDELACQELALGLPA